MQINKFKGWIPDRPDQRDAVFTALKAVRLPKQVDLRPMCSPVENQGQLGSCTANALVGALEYLEIKDKVHFDDLSRLFVYYNERLIEGSVKTDSGAMLRDGIKALVKFGVCHEVTWPYDVNQFSKLPPDQAYSEASQHKVTSYQRLSTLTDMKQVLASGFPFVFGFTVYDSFESDVVAKTGVVSMPGRNETAIGGHAVLAVGYDDAKKIIIVRNSWGSDWGMKGYFTMPYDYVSNRNLSDDFWTIKRGEGC